MEKNAAARPRAILAAGAGIQLLTGLPAAWGVFQQPVREAYALGEMGATARRDLACCCRWALAASLGRPGPARGGVRTLR